MKRRGKGFTLIELLIVVAIIAILALIAVPNFLEAQTRAKVSRGKADLRSLATAIEAYRVDNPTGPFLPFHDGPATAASNNRWNICTARGWPIEYGLWFILTTPVSYITTVPHDVFRRDNNEQWVIWLDYFRVWNIENNTGYSGQWGGPTIARLNRNGVKILMASVGPDRVEDIGDGSAGTGLPGQSGIVQYDPTNGTVSWGDVYYGLGCQFDVQLKAQL